MALGSVTISLIFTWEKGRNPLSMSRIDLFLATLPTVVQFKLDQSAFSGVYG